MTAAPPQTDRPADRPADRPNVIARPPLLVLGTLLVGLALEYLVWPTALVSPPARWIAGAVLVAAGLGLAVWAMRRFKAAGTNVPTPLPATAVVTDGPYRFSRNPIYVGGTLTYLGLAALADSLWVLVLVAPLLIVLRYGVIAREEAYLEAKFGEPYRAYKARVRRWL